jgi:hypothetical protein
VAFMQVHCFWLLESKFIFEFHLFESFPKCPNLLFPNLSTLPYLALQPSSSSSAQRPSQPAQLVQQPRRSPSSLALRPSGHRQPAHHRQPVPPA